MKINNFISSREINKVEFYILGDEDNLIDSSIEVKNKELFRNNKPVPSGIYDIKMGTTDLSLKCLTCFNKKNNCPGHYGHYILKYPVISPLFRKELIKWLKIICFKCGNLIFNYDILKKNIPANKILSFFIDHQRKSIKDSFINCFNCNEKHYNVTYSSKEFLKIFIKKENIEERIYNHEIEMIINRITDETILKLGKSLDSSPKKMILRIIKIPPTSIRPDITKKNGPRSNNNDSTTIIKNIVEFNNKLEPILDMNAVKKNISILESIELLYNDLIKKPPTSSDIKLQSNNHTSLTSITERFKGKPGRIRGNLMGKRTTYMARSVISGDIFIKIDEVGVPIVIAKNIQIPIKVTEYNIDELMIYFKNGINEYPGSTELIKNISNKKYAIPKINNNLKLEIGDILYRDIIDGDYVAMNRPPSMLFSSIGGHRVKILNKGDTLRISVTIVDSLYKGDFDGDAMVMIVSHSTIAKNECANLCNIKNWFVSYVDSTPSIGIYHDSLIGIFNFTKNKIEVNRDNLFSLLGRIEKHKLKKLLLNNNFLDKSYSGREILSIILKETNINYTGKSQHYNEEYSDFVDYNNDEINVLIDHGEIKTGRLGKKTVGQGVSGNIFHIMHNEIGSEKTLNIIYNLQQILNIFLSHNGCTINYDDITIPKDALKVVHERTSSIIYESNLITEKLYNGEIIAPIGSTVAEFYEQQQLANLMIGDDFLRPVLANIDIENNNLYNLIISGSKGKFLNFLQISSSIGQVTVNGERPAMIYDYQRTMPYFNRFHTSPESRGFILESYTSGVTNYNFIFQCMEARFALISKALSTSITGYQNRKSIKNLETLIIDNRRRLTKVNNVVQILYGDDGVDPRFVETVKFNSILLSNKEFEKKYKCTISLLNKIYHNKNIEKLLNEEYEIIKNDRNEYRNIFLNIENRTNKSKLITDTKKIPINIYRIIEDVIFKFKDVITNNNISINPIEFFEKVKTLQNDLLYCYYNEIQKNKKYEVAEHIKSALFLINISIRSNLYLKNIIEKNIPINILELIINRIINTFQKSLIDYGTAMGIIAAQCISAPMTQYVLSSHHRSGSGATKINFLQGSKEILGAQSTDKMKVTIMTLFLKDNYLDDDSIYEISNNIEMIPFETFVISYSVAFEDYKKIENSKYKHENKTMIEMFEKHNPSISIPNNLIKWCIRIVINKEKLIEKNMSIDTIIFKFKKIIPELFIVYMDNNTEDEIYFRIYIQNTYFKKYTIIDMDIIRTFINKVLLKTVIRGVNNIISSSIDEDIIRSSIDEEGLIQRNNIKTITTLGTNFKDILNNKFIDPYLSYSNSIIEIHEILGIEAAREKIITELKNLMDAAGDKHYILYADEMTYTGFVTSIEKKGMELREKNNILLHMSLSHVVQILEKSATNNLKADTNYGISAPLMVGKPPKTCANYNNILLDMDFINSNKSDMNDLINEI